MQVPVEILWGIAGFVGLKFLEWIYSLVKKQDEIKEQTIIDLKTGVKECTDAIRELKYEVKKLTEAIAHFPKMQKDLNELHVKIRGMERGGL